jgi:hypothetical protein
VLVFNIRNNFPIQKIFVDLSTVSVRLDPHRGKTTNWMHGRVNGTELPSVFSSIQLFVGQQASKPGRRSLMSSFVNLMRLSITQYISRVMKKQSVEAT